MNIKEHYSKGYRFYIIDGIAYPSNTSILKLFNKEKILDYNIKQTIGYIVKQGNLSKNTISMAHSYYKENLQLLADKGSDKHKLAADYLKYQKYIKDIWLDKFIKWVNESNFLTTPKLVEKFAYSSEYRIAGRIDMIGKIYGELIGIDIKTSSGIYNTHKMQCCGYDLMLKNKIKWAVLDISRNAKYKKFEILTDKEKKCYSTVFLALNTIFQELWKNGDLDVDVPY